MRRCVGITGLAILAVALTACMDSTSPNLEAESEETLATSVGGAELDPNSAISGGRDTTHPVDCAYDAESGWTTCGPTTRNGVTITRRIQFLDADGDPQRRPDSLTRSMRGQTELAGTIEHLRGTSNVQRTSEETVTGLGPGSSARVVNGTASGSENSRHTTDRGTLTVARQYSDTTQNLTFAVPRTDPYPSSGTMIRVMRSTVALNDGAPREFNVREVRRFESGGRMIVTTTVNGRTRTCTVQLGSRTRPVCE